MRKLILVLLPVAALVMIGIGCHKGGVPKGATAVVRYDRLAGPPQMAEAPYDGTFLLNRVDTGQTDWSKDLKKGDRIGFKPAATGSVIAVAGDEERTVPEMPYVWVRK